MSDEIEFNLRIQQPGQLLLAIFSALGVGAGGEAPLTGPAGEGQRFQSEAGIVTDARTGLQWSRQDVTSDALNWSDASAAANAFELGGHCDWRLPTRAELLTLVDDECSSPAIDTTAFPTCAPAWYWTSTPYATSPESYAWALGFLNGDAFGLRRYLGCRVRAVRGPVRQ